MKIETCSLAKSQPLSEAYVHAFDTVRSVYEYDLHDADWWRKRASDLERHRPFQADRTQLVSELRRYNEQFGINEAVSANLDRLSLQDALVVVGGQQAGLFTGPLLVIYKAITILQAAKEAERVLGRPVVPVFWIAGEDHDFDEVNHTYALTPGLEVERIRLEPLPNQLRTSASRLKIEEWADVIGRLDAALMQTEFKAPLLDKLRSYAAESETLVQLFGRIMTWLFGKLGLVLMDSDDPGLRRLEAPMFRVLLERHEQLHSAYVEGRKAVEALGFSPSAEVPEQGVNLFVFDDTGERVLLQPAENGFTDRKGQRLFTQADLDRWLQQEPQRFSNNVLTRPLMQDYLFPTIGVVLGSGEIAYWGLTGKAFQTLDMKMPPLIPRMEYTLVEGTIAKNMNKFDLTLENVLKRFEQLKADWLREQDMLRLEERFDAVRVQFRDQYEPLITLISGINPGMEKLGQTNLQKIIEQIDFLYSRASDANKTQFEGAIRQWDRIGLSLTPLGRLQERVYNVFSYLNRYGDGWIQELAEHPLELDGNHRVVYM